MQRACLMWLSVVKDSESKNSRIQEYAMRNSAARLLVFLNSPFLNSCSQGTYPNIRHHRYSAVAMQVGRLQRQLPQNPQLRKRLRAIARRLNVQC